MNINDSNKNEERLNSFLGGLLALDSGLIAFFVWIIKGDKLGKATLPFLLANFPFEPQILILASCVFGILLLQGLNLYRHDKPCFQRRSRNFAMFLLIMSLFAIGWAGIEMMHHPELLDGKKE